MKSFTIIITLAIIGFSAAFFRPAQPHQAPAIVEIRGGGFIFNTEPAFDEGLDNPEIQADESITAARKCGFCMGVSLCPVTSGLFFEWRGLTFPACCFSQPSLFRPFFSNLRRCDTSVLNYFH